MTGKRVSNERHERTGPRRACYRLARVWRVGARRADRGDADPTARATSRADTNTRAREVQHPTGSTRRLGYHLAEVELVEHRGLFAPRVVWCEAISGNSPRSPRRSRAPPTDDKRRRTRSVDDGHEAIELLKTVLERGAVLSKVVNSWRRKQGSPRRHSAPHAIAFRSSSNVMDSARRRRRTGACPTVHLCPPPPLMPTKMMWHKWAAMAQVLNCGRGTARGGDLRTGGMKQHPD